jgi:uncharacterized protein (DUF488 family)
MISSMTTKGGSSSTRPTIYTIGHSNHSFSYFVELLAKHGIETVVDVRSHPRSRFAPWSSDKLLPPSLSQLGVKYEYMGDALGGHPDDDSLYDMSGKVVYDRLAYTGAFRAGITKLVELSRKSRLALMCTEKNPRQCHRHALLARQLMERGVEVVHIRANGSLANAESLKLRQETPQMALFELPGEDTTWRSPKRIRTPR